MYTIRVTQKSVIKEAVPISKKMINAVPEITNIHFYHFYNLVTLGFEFNRVCIENQKVKDTIANHFSVLAGVSGKSILADFIDDSCLTDDNHYLLLHTTKRDIASVLFYCTNNKSDIYKTLNHLTERH